MITREQCRAARSFLGLKQKELAEDCGLSKTAITHFESGLFNLRTENMLKLRLAFEKRGIEFIGNYGVQKKQINFYVLDNRHNATALPELWDDIFESFKEEGGEVLISHLNEREAFDTHPEKLRNHLRRLKEHNISERLLVCEGATFFIQNQDCYRWLRKDVYKTCMTSFLYANKLALQFWNGHFILLIDHPDIYKEEKDRFEYLWDTALIPPNILI